jgi:hypothetical protein
MHFLTPILLLIVACLIRPPLAVAECGCFCVDGARITLCTGVDEAQANVDRCGLRPGQTCPVSLDVPARQAYPAPVEGVMNCRDAYVYDAGAESHASLKVCDVEPRTGARSKPIGSSGGGHLA